MLIVTIDDNNFIEKCLPIAKNFILTDNSRYVFRDGLAVAFNTFQKYTKPSEKGYVPTQSAQATKLRRELEAVNGMRKLLALCKEDMYLYVLTFSITCTCADIWDRAFVVVTKTEVRVHFPDAEGSVQYVKPLVEQENKSTAVPTLVKSELVAKLINVCGAAGIEHITPGAAASTLERAFYMRPPLRNHVAYGYALVLLMQDEYTRCAITN